MASVTSYTAQVLKNTFVAVALTNGHFIFTRLDGSTYDAGLALTPRVVSVISTDLPIINTNTVDMFKITALAVNITSFTTYLTGTPIEGQLLHIVIIGTAARTLAWGTAFESSSCALPLTVDTNRLDIRFTWNSATSKWRCLAVA